MRADYSKFLEPSGKYRGKPFWAWNGKLEKEELLRQIDVFKEMGFGGYFMHSRTGLATEYLGTEWFELINACADYGERQEMESWLYDEDRWPSGTAGGMASGPEKYRAHFLVMECFNKDEYAARDMRPDEMAFACVLENGELVRYYKLQKGREAGAGETVAVFYEEPAKEQDIYNGATYLDTMNPEAVQYFISITHEAYHDKCNKRLGSSIKGIFTDEPHRNPMFTEFNNGRENAVPYTPGLFEKFEQRFGYQLHRQLPDLFFRKKDQPLLKVKWDYIELCQELFLESYAVPMQKWCNEHHIIFTGHVLHEDTLTAQTVMQGSLMRFYEYMDIPGVDVLFRDNENWWIIKQAVSVARQMGKDQLLSELYGCTGWQMSFQDYKNCGDWQALFGVNFRCQHLSWYTMKGEGKRDYPASIFFQSAWYQEYKYVEDYFSRINCFLEGAQPECKLLVLNPVESVWARAYGGAFDCIDPRDTEIKFLEKRYRDTFQYLTEARIDFEYGDEGILESAGKIQNGKILVGCCFYDRVLVTGMDTMRSSTLHLLRQLLEEGGEVIFAGKVPSYVDARRSGEVLELAGTAKRIPFTRSSIAGACADGTEITVGGEAQRDILARSYRDGNDRKVMLLNKNWEAEYRDVPICLGAGKSASCWNARNGQVYPVNCKEEEGKLYVNISFAKGEEKLFLISDEKDGESRQPQKEEGSTYLLPDCFQYELSEKNICVLDMAKVSIKGAEFGSMEVLRADRAIRDHLGLCYRGGEMRQPWYEDKNEKCRRIPAETVDICYTIRMEVLCEAELAVEDISHIRRIEINGKAISLCPSGIWIDPCFARLKIPKEYLIVGGNSIVLTMDYDRDSGIESVWLLGDFGVRLEEGSLPVIIGLPDKVSTGDISNQGFPFYSGKITYRFPEVQGISHVRMADFRGACAILRGKQEVILGFEPFEGCVEDLWGIQIVFGRRNTFGPLHQFPREQPYVEPASFLTEGNNWSGKYVLYEQGMLEKPEVKVIKPH